MEQMGYQDRYNRKFVFKQRTKQQINLKFKHKEYNVCKVFYVVVIIVSKHIK